MSGLDEITAGWRKLIEAYEPKNYKMTQEDLEFLVDLDKKLHYIGEGKLTNLGGKTRPVYFDSYHDEKLSDEELDRFLGLMNKEEYAITPMNTNLGLSAGFTVFKIEALGFEYGFETVLMFKMNQLPEGTEWSKMADCYMSKRNLELLSIIGIEKPKPEFYHYGY